MNFDSKVYCVKRTDSYKLHEIVEEIDWDNGKTIYKCMWCKRVFK